MCREWNPIHLQTINNHRIRLKPSLFQHIGVHSSLSGKVQKLKEKDFGKQPIHRPHPDNPPAKVSTSLKVYQKYTLESAYKGDSYFWSLLPQAGDFVRFDFDPPIRLIGKRKIYLFNSIVSYSFQNFSLRKASLKHSDGCRERWVIYHYKPIVFCALFSPSWASQNDFNCFYPFTRINLFSSLF